MHLELIVSNRFTAGIDGGEVSAIAQLWIKTIGVSQGLFVETHTEVTNSLDVIRKRIDDSSLDMITMSALDYLNLDRSSLLEPVVTMSSSRSPKGKIKYLLLTNQDSGFSSLESLKDTTILTYTHADQAMSHMWTEVLLNEHHLPQADKYFRSISAVLKPSTACLPVYFRKADACIIDDATWDVLKELNPQLAAKLQPIAESPSLLETILCLHVNRKVYRPEIINGLAELSKSPTGRQLLLFFKARNSYSIGRSDLTEVIDLRKAYLRRFPALDRRLPLHSAGLTSEVELRRAQ